MFVDTSLMGETNSKGGGRVFMNFIGNRTPFIESSPKLPSNTAMVTPSNLVAR